jgi:hypothetical protein
LRELSLHVLDIAENGITAGADLIQITVREALGEDRLTITIADNGRGMPPEKLKNPADPFITTRTTRRVGLGLSLLSAAAQRCGGALSVNSAPGRGTEVTATFVHSHIDRAPIGDMASSVTTLIMGNPGVDFVYRHEIDGRHFTLDTREVRREMPDLPLQEPAVICHLTDTIRASLKQLAAGDD